MARSETGRIERSLEVRMSSRRAVLVALPLAVLLAAQLGAQSPRRWKIHDMTRPVPDKVSASLPLPVPPPSDAIVLFDGTDLSKWRAADGGPAKWIIKDGSLIAVAGGGPVYTRDGYGDVQLHVEWAAPTPGSGKGQGRGNSGVFLMGKYEVQVLDSHENVTYVDGQAAAVYGQYPPLVNASRPAGTWQAYDIVFRRPRFRPDGTVAQPARVTVLHNGVLVQDNSEIWGPTGWLQHLPYESHPDRLPLSLQDHGNPVLYRNIWLRELDEEPRRGPEGYQTKPLMTMTPETLDRYVGKYGEGLGQQVIVSREGETLYAKFGLLAPLELLPHSKKEFSLRWTAATVLFDLGQDGIPTALTFHIGGDARPAARMAD